MFPHETKLCNTFYFNINGNFIFLTHIQISFDFFIASNSTHSLLLILIEEFPKISLYIKFTSTRLVLETLSIKKLKLLLKDWSIMPKIVLLNY